MLVELLDVTCAHFHWTKPCQGSASGKWTILWQCLRWTFLHRSLYLYLSCQTILHADTNIVMQTYTCGFLSRRGGKLLIAAVQKTVIESFSKSVLSRVIYNVMYLVTFQILIEDWAQLELISKPFICNFDASNLITNGPMKTLSEIKTVTNADFTWKYISMVGLLLSSSCLSPSFSFTYIYLIISCDDFIFLYDECRCNQASLCSLYSLCGLNLATEFPCKIEMLQFTCNTRQWPPESKVG